ncbi:MAG: uroporphyrinogen decarboxylase family protein [Promethearchaeota archaeon]
MGILKITHIINARERILKALDHEEADRVLTFEMEIDNFDICHHFNEEYVYTGITKSVQDTYNLYNGDLEKLTQTIIKAKETKGFLKNIYNMQFGLYDKIGIDLFACPITGYIMMPSKADQSSFTDEYGRIFDLKENPDDGLELFYYREGACKSFEDYEALLQPAPDNPRRKKYFMTIKKIEKEKDYRVYGTPALWGTFEAVWQTLGFTAFSKLLSKPKQMKKIFDDRGQFLVDVLKRYIEWGEDSVIFVFDDFGYKTGLLMSPRNYNKYVFPWLTEICKTAHKAGIKVVLHSCGDVSGVLDEILKAGIDGLHPIEPTTANPEYDIFKLKEKNGDRLTFVGNVSPQDLANKDVDYIKDYTKKLIKEVAPGGGFILSSGHSINPAVKLENFLAMHEIHKKYGNYPIQIS